MYALDFILPPIIVLDSQNGRAMFCILVLMLVPFESGIFFDLKQSRVTFTYGAPRMIRNTGHGLGRQQRQLKNTVGVGSAIVD